LKPFLPYGLCIAVCALCACAEIATPTGGPQDTEGPVAVEQVPAQAAVSVSPSKIVVTYDEFIALKDAFNQVLISPPLVYEPEYKVRGKRLEIRLLDTLLSNRTYQFFLGDAVRDLNEGNIAQSQDIVFSTGPSIDSLNMSGRLEDAFTLEPMENALVMLYDATDPGAVKDQSPTYATRTDKNGAFSFSYLAYGTYGLAALKDANFNYRFDLPNEAIAFASAPIVLNSDTALSLPLRGFVEDAGKGQLVKARSPRPGQVNASFNGTTSKASLSWQPKPACLLWNERGDSVKAWFSREDEDSTRITQVLTDTTLSRLVVLKQTEATEEPARTSIGILTSLEETSASKGSEDLQRWQELNRPLILRFTQPIIGLDSTGITIIDSANNRLELRMRWTNPAKTQLELNPVWPSGSALSLMVEPGAFTGLWGNRNDSLILPFKTRKADRYGTLNWIVHGGDTTQYVLQLLDQQDRLIESTQCLESCTWNMDRIKAGSYRLRAIVDQNRNGRWDAGLLDDMVQPELVYYYPETVSLRADWTLDNNWNIEDVQNAAYQEEK
jgi:uncharacterized protein (DUF2141 family)